MRNVVDTYVEKFGREPDNEQIAWELGIPVHKVALLKTMSVRPASLDAPLGEDADARVLGDVVGDDNARSPDEELNDRTLIDDLRAIVNSLGPREAKILTLRFGLDGGEKLSLEAVGRRFNVTRERIRQLQYGALRQIRQQMQEQVRQRSRDEIAAEHCARKRAEVFREFVVLHSARRAGHVAPTG
jgi:RNA polymerase primary sigma factor